MNSTQQPQSNPIEIEIWSDLVCPWCYVGKNRLDLAIKELELSDRVQITMRAFELDPTAQKESEPVAEAFSKRKGVTVDQFEQMTEQVRQLAIADGLEYAHGIHTANTVTVHRLSKYAETQNRGTEFFDSVQKAYFSGIINPFSTEELVEFAVEFGFDKAEVLGVIESEQYETEVRQDEATARELGISGVPFMVLSGKYGVPGAQSVEVYTQVLQEVQKLAAE